MSDKNEQYENEEYESDTDSENDEIDFNKKTENQNNNQITDTNKDHNKVFNQSRQNFEKFAQMAKNNNVDQSYSEKTLSKEDEDLEDSQDNDNCSNKETNNFGKNNNENSKGVGKVKQENKRKNPLQTEKDDYNETSYDNGNNLNEGEDNELSEEEIENFDKNNYPAAEANKETQKLDFFNIDDFYELDVDDEAKELLNDMKKFTPNRDVLILDTKMKPYIPNYVPSIGEVDAFIKLNRPDNKLEELGLDYIDEPAINGIDPSIFSLELAYKLKSKIPEGSARVIKNIEEAHKNPKVIQNWIDNLENLHKETSSGNMDYSNKMPDLESLMQVLYIYITIFF